VFLDNAADVIEEITHVIGPAFLYQGRAPLSDTGDDASQE
jgi:hypothetical protein